MSNFGGSSDPAISEPDIDVGPKIEVSKQSTTTHPRESADSAPRPKDIMRVTLLIPADEYDDWKPSLPASVKVIETKILDNDERARLGL